MSLKEIASRVGTSVTTVSLVLNQKDVRVSSEKRKEIMAVAREIGYTKRTIDKTIKSVGVIVPDICNIYYAELIKGIIRHARENGYNTIVCDSDLSENGDLSNLENLHQSGVEGIIIAKSVSTKSGMEQLRRMIRQRFWSGNIPIVMIDRNDSSLNTFSVCINHYQGAFLATDYLVKLGHKRIACLSGTSNLEVTADRLAGYKDALKEADIYDEALIVSAGYDRNSGYEGFNQFIDKNITAVFSMNDEAAIGACLRARELGIRIPEDMSIIGYDDISLAKFNDVPLSTVRQPIDLMAKLAISMIHDSILGGDGEKDGIRNNIVLQPELVIRESTAPLNNWEEQT